MQRGSGNLVGHGKRKQLDAGLGHDVQHQRRQELVDAGDRHRWSASRLGAQRNLDGARRSESAADFRLGLALFGKRRESDFSYVFSDANGYGDISSIQIVVNETLLSSDSCYFYYLLAANQLYLRNDASSSAWRVAAAAGARPFQQLQTRRHASILTRQPLNKGLRACQETPPTTPELHGQGHISAGKQPERKVTHITNYIVKPLILILLMETPEAPKRGKSPKPCHIRSYSVKIQPKS